MIYEKWTAQDILYLDDPCEYCQNGGVPTMPTRYYRRSSVDDGGVEVMAFDGIVRFEGMKSRG